MTECCWGVVLCSFMSFTLEIKHVGGQGKAPPFLGRSPFLLTLGVGSRVSQLTQLLLWCLWDVGPAVLVSSELGLHIFWQNTHIPDVREDFTFFQLVPHSHDCLCASTSQISWPAVSPEPVSMCGHNRSLSPCSSWLLQLQPGIPGRLEEFVGRQWFTAPSVALFSLP